MSKSTTTNKTYAISICSNEGYISKKTGVPEWALEIMENTMDINPGVAVYQCKREF